MEKPTRKEISFDRTRPYHVLARAVDGRTIFKSEETSNRFIFQMYATNHGSPASSLHRRDIEQTAQALLRGEDIPKNFIVAERPPLVHFLSFVQVVNHYHFCLVPNAKDGISKYMQKLNGAFARYFNLKHSRRGALFESRYKLIPIETSTQLDAILRYINVKNALDVYQPGWRETGLRNAEEGWKFLFHYPYSSFPDLFGPRTSKIIASPEIREQFFGTDLIYSKDAYLEFIQEVSPSGDASFENLYLKD